jgi:hypothetical protein
VTVIIVTWKLLSVGERQLSFLYDRIVGIIFSACAIVFNKTIAGKSYIYPLIPFHWSELKKRFFRGRLPHTRK